MALQLTNLTKQPLLLVHAGQVVELAPEQTILVPGEKLSHSQRVAQLAGNLLAVHVPDGSARFGRVAVAVEAPVVEATTVEPVRATAKRAPAAKPTADAQPVAEAESTAPVE